MAYVCCTFFFFGKFCFSWKVSHCTYDCSLSRRVYCNIRTLITFVILSVDQLLPMYSRASFLSSHQCGMMRRLVFVGDA